MKLQNNQSGTVNGLLEELRKSEENLLKERKKSNSEIELCHKNITELQLQLDKTKEILEENLLKSRNERSEKDLKLLQLESELERVKNTTGKYIYSIYSMGFISVVVYLIWVLLVL